MNFKKGDIIRGKKLSPTRYWVTNHSMTMAKVIEPRKYGKMKIKILEHEDLTEIGQEYVVDNSNEYFELVKAKNECIVIYRKDNTMVALDKVTGEKAIATCSPDDTFDYKVGAKLAFERLMDGEKNGNGNYKVLCLKDVFGVCGKPRFKKGRLYEYVGGNCINCENELSSDGHQDYEELISTNACYDGKLFEVKEVKRSARVGEYVKIVDAAKIPETDGKPDYKNDDVLQIIECEGCGMMRYSHSPSSNSYSKFLNVSEYVVLEGDYPKEIDKSVSNTDVGCYVEVVDNTKTRNLKGDWEILKGYESNYISDKKPENGVKYRLIKIQSDCAFTSNLTLIQNPDTTQVFVVDVEGLEKC